MTVQNEQSTNTTAVQKVIPPQIEGEVDIPFDNTSAPYAETRQNSLSRTDSLDDEITKFKYLTGRKVLFISMGAMGIAVLASIVLSILNIQSSLVENAFEVFKLIAMTVLGYIFGSKTK